MNQKLIDLTNVIREKFKGELHRPVSEELAIQMTENINPDAIVGLFDAGCVIAITLIARGHDPAKINVIEKSQDKCYNEFSKSMAKKMGFNQIVPPMGNLNRIDMKFDVVIGNPPYQRDTKGDRGGSSSNPLWWEFSNIAFNLVKEGGVVSLITPDNIMSGGEQFTSLLIGSKAKYDLKLIDFSANDHFSVGIKICRWVAIKRNPTGEATNNGIAFDPTKVGVVFSSPELNSIITTMCGHESDKLNFNTSNRWDKAPITKRVKKQGNDIALADLKNDSSELYPHAVMNNDKIKYSHFSSKDVGVWRVFVPQFSTNTKFFVDDTMAATASTWTHRCNSKEEAEKIKDIVSDSRYIWVIDQLKVSKRISSSIRYLPIVPIEEVLNDDQLEYIQSQL